MSNNRTKGHNLERLLANIFRNNFGFNFTSTSRNSSRLLDNCKVDIDGIPFNLQAKSGYDRSPPKFKDIYTSIKTALKESYPPEDPRHNYPVILVHKDNSRKKEGFTWTFRHVDIVTLLEDYYTTKQQLRELKEKYKIDN